MTRDEILSAGPVALSVEAHRILGRTIENDGRMPGGSIYYALRVNGCLHNATTSPRGELTQLELKDLGLAHYADSWADAQELWEHEKWPQDTTIVLSYDPDEDGAMRTWHFARNERMGLMRNESSLPMLITRVFVLANGGTEETK